MSLSRVSGATSTGSTVVCPTVQDGDLLVLYDCGTSTGSAPTKVIPTDFTEAYSWTSGTAPRPTGAISYAVVAPGTSGTWSGSTITGIDGNIGDAKMLEVTDAAHFPLVEVKGAGTVTPDRKSVV